MMSMSTRKSIQTDLMMYILRKLVASIVVLKIRRKTDFAGNAANGYITNATGGIRLP